MDGVMTVAQIAKRFDVPAPRVDYLVRTRGLTPVARVGTVRLFAPEQVEQIGIALEEIAAWRQRVHAST